ncbi:MAG TPA: hypothetical protein VFE61_18430 [Candidatus Sulfotelmatobacter sp.]|jgi:hypothetical protein|nr:hypothetical protein [Candidatus Sulfotelmatobacter sp.]
MTARLSSLVLLAALLVCPLSAKDKNKSTLPEYVLRARTVLVVVAPEAGEPLDQPMANTNARENVEKALMEWGRLQPVLDGAESDLVIAVRTGNGKMVRPTIKGGPIDNRPGVAQPTDGGVRIGGQHGQPPPISETGTGPMDRGPHVSNEIGPSEDSFEVYQGRIQYPLDSSPVWRYIAKDCLRPPKVSAVEEFRKAMADAEKPQIPKKP